MADDIKTHPDEEPEDEGLESSSQVDDIKEKSHHRRRVKVRKKVRQRVRIKKKPSLKRRLKKVVNYVAWIIVIGGFIATVYVLMRELDIKDENAKKKAPKKKQAYHDLNNTEPALLLSMSGFKKVIHFE